MIPQDLRSSYTRLIEAGIPLFVAKSSPSKLGFLPPSGWQDTEPDLAVLDKWRPGDALCMVCGHGFDVIDVDPRNGGSYRALREALADAKLGTPDVYGLAETPSGGSHIYIRSLDVAKAGKIVPGVDLQAGRVSGKSRGFVFLPPTERESKTDGVVRAYQWRSLLREVDWGDVSGLGLRSFVEQRKPKTDKTVGGFFEATRTESGVLDDPYGALLNHGRHNGVIKIVGALAARGFSQESAARFLEERVWPAIAQVPADTDYPRDEFEHDVEDAWGRYQLSTEDETGEVVGIPEGVSLEDSRLAVMLAKRLQGRFLFTEELGTLRWESPVWVPERGVHALTQEVVEFVEDLYTHATTTGASEKSLSALSRLFAQPRVDRLVKAVQSVPSLRANASEFDTEALRIATPDGVLDLTTGDVTPPTPDDRTLGVTLGCYRPGLTHPLWEQALEAIPDDQRYVYQRRIGQMLVGEVSTEVLINYGSGANGKSTLTDAIVNALGAYATVLSDGVFSEGSEAAVGRLALRGVRVAVVEELPERGKAITAGIKRLVDSSTVTARQMYRGYTTFRATHALIVNTNHLPDIPELEHGIWRRFEVVPFTRRWPDTGGDLKQRLCTDRDAIDAVFTWAVQGLLAASTDPAPAPTDVSRAALNDWREDMNLVGQFLAERTTPEPGNRVPLVDVYRAFNAWSQERGYASMSLRLFQRRLSSNAEAHDLTVYRGRTAGAELTPGSALGDRAQLVRGLRLRPRAADAFRA